MKGGGENMHPKTTYNPFDRESNEKLSLIPPFFEFVRTFWRPRPFTAMLFWRFVVNFVGIDD